MGIPARIFATLLRIVPGRTRNWMWKWWYQRLAKAHGRADFRFMNYGYKDGKELKLLKEDEPNRLFIQLYNMMRKSILRNSNQKLIIQNDENHKNEKQ